MFKLGVTALCCVTAAIGLVTFLSVTISAQDVAPVAEASPASVTSEVAQPADSGGLGSHPPAVQEKSSPTRKVKKNKRKLGPAPDPQASLDVAPQSPGTEVSQPGDPASSNVSPVQSETVSNTPNKPSSKKKKNKKNSVQQNVPPGEPSSNSGGQSTQPEPEPAGAHQQPETSTKKPKSKKPKQQKNSQNISTAPPSGSSDQPSSPPPEQASDLGVAPSQTTPASSVVESTVAPTTTTKRPVVKVNRNKIEKATTTPVPSFQETREKNRFSIVPFRVEWVTEPPVPIQKFGPPTVVSQPHETTTEPQFIELFVPGAPSVEEVLARAGVFGHGTHPGSPIDRPLSQVEIVRQESPVFEVLVPEQRSPVVVQHQVVPVRTSISVQQRQVTGQNHADPNSPFFAWLGDFRSRINVHMNRLKKSFDTTFSEPQKPV